MAMQYQQKAHAALQLYEGIYRPTTPKIDHLYVGKITSVSAVEFQKMIDDLSDGAGPASDIVPDPAPDNTSAPSAEELISERRSIY